MPNLLFCMTPGVSLQIWENIGTLQRELRPYEEYLRRGWKVKILTFDRKEVPDVPEGIETVLVPGSHLLLLLPWTHKKLGKWADIIKANQSYNAHFYTRAARYWKKPILLRCGYVHGEYLETTAGPTLKTRCYQRLEKKAFQGATHCQVPTEDLLQWTQERYDISKEKTSVVPNYVDTDIFRPLEGIQKRDNSVISVGRLTHVKRFDMLIRACSEVPGCTLTIVGEGEERHNLEGLARSLSVELRLPGNIHNEELPRILQEHRIFAITSEREGHPKALLEAMACEMPCLCVDRIGIRNIIENARNGLLIGASSNELTRGLETLLGDTTLKTRLAEMARKDILKYYGFNKCFDDEYNTVLSMLDMHPYEN